MDESSAAFNITNIRTELRVFFNEQEPSEQFYAWRSRALNLLEDVFGKSSEEYVEFRGLKFELPDHIAQSFENKARNELRQSLAEPFVFATERSRYYYQRLYDAEEFLLACAAKASHGLS